MKARSITTKRHEDLCSELPSYADMHEWLENRLSNLKGIGNEAVKIKNLMSVLEQAAKLITTQDIPHEDAETLLNELLR